MKESESEDECVGSMHGSLLSELWYESDDHVTRQVMSDMSAGFRYTPGVTAHT